jgi:hypothetical protein
MLINGKQSTVFLLTPIHFAPTAYFHNQYAQSAVLYVANDAVITYSIFPKIPKPRAFEGFPNTTRVIKNGYALP